MLPADYQDAEWRNTTATVCPCRDRIGIGLRTASGEIVRLAIDADSARHLIETLGEAISDETATLTGRKGSRQ